MIPTVKTGSALLLALVSAAAWGAEPEITMQVDREKVGIEDTFRVDIVVSNMTPGAQLTLPSGEFEVLGRSQSTQMSYSVGPTGGVMSQVQRHTLTVRANKEGRLTIPPAQLKYANGLVQTRPITLEVVPGRLEPDRPQRRAAQNPFGLPPGFPFDDDGFGDSPFEEPEVPRGSDSDLFLKMTVDKNEAYVGEQIMLTIHLYSRMDLSSVDGVTMPKLDGFFSQDFKTPSQLAAEQRVINGVPYREYVLRQRAIFALKPGSIPIEAPEADVTTGLFLAGRRLHRKSNELRLTIRDLPPGPATSIVGKWRLSREVSQTQVALGEPVQVKLVLEGRGNLQAVQLPELEVPAAFRRYDPETVDKVSLGRTHVGGTRTVEYTLMPQQTGTFTLPALAIPYFDPDERRYEEMRLDPITLTVTPGAGGSNVLTVPGATTAAEPAVKNQLVASGLKSLRHTASFVGPRTDLSQRGWFWPSVAAPALLTALALGVLGLRARFSVETTEGKRSKEAKAARKRLAHARKILTQGSTTEFYAEVERALLGFLSAKLGFNVVGLQRHDLLAKLNEAGVGDAERERIARVLETSDFGRYAPGMGDATQRQKALEEAEAAMERWS